jgi:hypothetical protein
MKASVAALAGVLVLGTVCAAQDDSVAVAGTDSNQSVAAAARANRLPKIDPAKEVDIRRLMGVMGSKATMAQMLGDMEKNIKPLLTSSLPPGEYRERLVQVFLLKFESKLDLAAMSDLAIPVYDKYLSHAEIKGMIEFYSTPLGHKITQVLPQLASECMENGRKWGEHVGRESMTEVLAENPDLKKALEESSKSARQ